MNEAKMFHTKIPKISSVKQKKPAFASINVPIQQKTVRRKKTAPTWISPETSPETSVQFFCTIEAL
jgi:hypothetical protein